MNRIKKVQEKVSEFGLDAFLVLEKTNRQYLSGFTGSAGMLAITQKDARLFVDDRYLIRAKKESNVAVHRLDSYSNILKNVRMLKVGLEDKISLASFLELKSKIRGKKWKVMHNLVETLRMQKSAPELKAIEKGSWIIDRVFERVKRAIKGKKGVTEAEIAYQIEKLGKNLGAEGNAFDPIVAFGPNAAAPHHLSSSRKIGRNNFLLLDFGFKVNGYHSDFTRTLFLGKPNKHQEKVYNIVLNAQALGIKSVTIGIKAANVHKVGVDEFKKHKLDKFFTHNTGHGVGLEIHELPNLSFGSEDVLIKNSVVTVEPGIYLPGKFGVRIEDMVLVRERPEIFSRVAKDLASMII